MDKPIGPGDLVAVVRACCEFERRAGMGVMFTVDRVVFLPSFFRARCSNCDHQYPGSWAYATQLFTLNDGERGIGAPVAWLQRINPPAMKQTVPPEKVAV